MSSHPPPAAPQTPTPPGITLGFLGVVVLAVALLALTVFGPGLTRAADAGLRLGNELAIRALEDPAGGLTAEQVAQLPDHAFERLQGGFNVGYTSSAYWLRIAAPALPRNPTLTGHDPLWLEILPPYLDEVTLYQHDGERWRAQRAGDRVSEQGRVGVRQLLFPLKEGQPLLLRVKTSSPMQLEGSVWRTTDLLAHFSRDEWASGLFMGLNLTLALLITGAAITLRKRALWAMALAAVVTLVHGAVDRGYLHLLLPAAWAHWSDLAVKIGTLTLPAAMAWQAREIMTWGTDWRRTDLALIVLGVAPLLCLPAIALGNYADWAWVGVSAPWIVCALWSVLAWANLLRQDVTLANLLMAGPSTVMVAFGCYIVAVYLGWLPSPQVETSMFWQFITSQLSLLVTLSVAAALVEQYRASAARQVHLVDQLRQSEHALDERVRQRTNELLETQNSLQLMLHRERQLREDQRHFFNMINHEFRTPLAVIDSAAAEQQRFPSDDAASQVTRATQIRRACRRLTTLVDNCLMDERLDTDGFAPRPQHISVHDLVEDGAQMARWSPKHDVRLDLAQAPDTWTCDPMLARIALSNLVDNAVKYGHAGRIEVLARTTPDGQLEISVTDEGPRLPADIVSRLFELGHRGDRDASGFGLGLWVSRRIARLHGGDLTLDVTAPGTGNRFVLTLSPDAGA